MIPFEKMNVILKYLPCKNLLIFGLGYESIVWTTNNKGYKTTFIENERNKISKFKFLKEPPNTVDIIRSSYGPKCQVGVIYPKLSELIDPYSYDVVLINTDKYITENNMLKLKQDMLLAKYSLVKRGVLLFSSYHSNFSKRIDLDFNDAHYKKEILTFEPLDDMLIINKM